MLDTRLKGLADYRSYRERARDAALDVAAADLEALPVAVPQAPLPSRRLYHPNHVASVALVDYVRQLGYKRGLWRTIRRAEAIVRKGGGRMGTQWGVSQPKRRAGTGPLAIRRLDKF